MAGLWLEPFAGVSGDMVLGALVDLGLPLAALQADVGRLRVGLRLTARRVKRAGLAGTAVYVQTAAGRDHDHAGHAHRGLGDIARIIRRAGLPPAVQENSLAVFTRLARVEANRHRMSLARVHFHEVGALDAIADIVGACAGLDRLGVARGSVRVGPVNVGGGWIQSQHGGLPVPAPATLELLTGFEIYSAGPRAELATPTGAALVAELGKPAGRFPAAEVVKAGYGAGSRSFPDFPNLLRAVLVREGGPEAAPWAEEEMTMMSTDIDDATPQVLAAAAESLRAAGAADVLLVPVIMKKGRPGTRLEVLCQPDRVSSLAGILFRETPTLGIRVLPVRRLALRRRLARVNAAAGRIRVKVGYLGDAVVTATPEFEDARAGAQRLGRPVRDVIDDARLRARFGPRVKSRPGSTTTGNHARPRRETSRLAARRARI